MIRPMMTALALALAASAAQAEGFALLTYETPAQLAERARPDTASEYWERWTAVAGALAQAGVLRGGSALAASSEPGAPSGFFTIDVKDEAAARSWARRLEAAGAHVVVRRLQANPAMR